MDRVAKKPDRACEAPLTSFERGFRGRVTLIAGANADLVSSFGIYIGSKIEIKQTRPSYVIRVEDTEIALESAVASQIVVRGSKAPN